MGRKKKLLCQCGQVHLIETALAGSTLRCDCGIEILVPTLREIVQLEDAEETLSTQRRSRWTRQQGILFAIGVTLFFVGLGVAAILINMRPPAQLPGIDGKIASLDTQLAALTPAETLTLWGYYQGAPGAMVDLPGKIEKNHNRRQLYTTLTWSLVLAGTVAGAGCIIVSLRTRKVVGAN
ncbi:MAG: hypothetical protein VX431_01165 [Planctomycetota bacterium]|nr:hypothetical protein [Planctomycetota bacterium]